jgi:hypothetical protein
MNLLTNLNNNGRIVADDTPLRIFSNLELLSENDLEAPQITQLSIRLGFIALNNEDFIKIIKGE